MMENTKREALLGASQREQEAYRRRLLRLPPEDILNHVFEYAIREDILFALEETDSLESEYELLLQSKSPIADIYREYCKLESEYMDEIRLAVDMQIKKLSEREYGL